MTDNELMRADDGGVESSEGWAVHLLGPELMEYCNGPAACLVNVGYSGVKLTAGRGLQIDSINPGSAFANDTIRVGDVILEADDQVVNSPADLSRIIDSNRGRLRVKLKRKDSVMEVSMPRGVIRDAKGTSFDRLGITTSPGRDLPHKNYSSRHKILKPLTADLSKWSRSRPRLLRREQANLKSDRSRRKHK